MSYAVVTTVLNAAASYDLTDLETVKGELSLADSDTSNDAWLSARITEVSRAIARHCKRPFAPELVQDLFDIQQDPYPYQTPGGFAQLELTHWPVLGLVSVVQTLAGGATPTTQTLLANVDYRADLATGRLQRLNPFTGVATLWEALPVTVTYTGGFGALVSETNSVPASSPYQVTISQEGAFSCDQQVNYASGSALTRVAANPAQGQYTVAGGVYTFSAADAGQSLSFTYCTAVIPPDLVGICLQLITARFAAKGRDPALIQREVPGIGVQRWWFGAAPGQKGQFPPDLEAALDYFRLPTLA